MPWHPLQTNLTLEKLCYRLEYSSTPRVNSVPWSVPWSVILTTSMLWYTSLCRATSSDGSRVQSRILLEDRNDDECHPR